MVKNLTFKERIITMAFIFLVGVLGGGLTFYALSSFNIRSTSTNTERVIERQVYIENSSAIASVKMVSQSIVTIVNKESLASRDKQDGQLGQACFNGAASCQKIGVVLTSDGLIISAHDLNDQELADSWAIDAHGVQYQLIPVGKLGAAKIYQMVITGEAQLSKEQRTNYFDLRPILLADSSFTEVGQNVFGVESGWLNSLRIGSGVVVGKFTQQQSFKQISADYLPVWLNFNEQLKGSLYFDLSGELLMVHNAGGNVSSEQVMAFLKRYAENNEKFEAVNIGLKCLSLDKLTAANLGYKVDYGCLIAGGLDNQGAIVNGGIEKDSLADKAGLKPKDIILEMDNTSLIKADLGMMMLNKTPGSKIVLVVLRDGKTIDLTATL